jgi:hypothetical protein
LTAQSERPAALLAAGLRRVSNSGVPKPQNPILDINEVPDPAATGDLELPLRELTSLVEPRRQLPTQAVLARGLG